MPYGPSLIPVIFITGISVTVAIRAKSGKVIGESAQFKNNIKVCKTTYLVRSVTLGKKS